MPEAYNDDLWRESEQDDSSSSMDSYLYLESSNDTDIITVPAEHVPRVYSEVEQTFQRERFMRAFRIIMADIDRETQDGGAPGSTGLYDPQDPEPEQYLLVRADDRAFRARLAWIQSIQPLISECV